MRWGKKEKNQAAELWRKGHVAREIAATLGVTRNAVIGFLYRSGLSRANADRRRAAVKPPAPKPKLPAPARFTARAPRPVAFALPNLRLIAALDASEFDPEIAVTFAELAERHCRFIYGDPRNFDALRFCGAAKNGVSSYCALHFRLSHSAPKET